MKTQPGSVSEPAAESVALSPTRETDRVRIITETIVMVALAGALYLIKIFTLPQGGSVTLGSRVPIFLLALRRGPRIGIIGGVAFGLVAPGEAGSSRVGVTFSPPQVILRHPRASARLGPSVS